MADDTFKLVVRVGNTESADVGGVLSKFMRKVQRAWDGEPQRVQGVLREYLLSVAQALVARHSGSATGPKSLARRTGKTLDTVIRSVQVQGSTWGAITGTIGGNATVAVHEYGANVKSKGKLLAIPLPAARLTTGAGTKPSDWENTFVAKTRAGNLIIFQRRASTIVPLFLLRDSVTIPARLGMREELNAQMPYFLPRTVDRVIADITNSMNKG